MKEIWKDIPGYERLYKVSNFGIIKSLIRKNRRKEKILVQTDDNNGYLGVNLYKNNIPKTFKIHTLVLEAFVGSCPSGTECRHLDGYKKNNRLDNLKYGTRSENTYDKILHGTHVDNRGSKCATSKLNELDIPKIREMINNKYTCSQIAKIFNVNRRTIQDIKLNKTWRHI